jgi:hypothetical protein
MVRLFSLSYSEFFYSFPCLFVHYSVIYHCFPSATYIDSFPFFVLLFVLVQYLPSIFFDQFHQSLPLCIFPLVFGFSFLITPLLFQTSCSSFSYSPDEVLSLFSFIASSTRLLVVFISLPYIVIIFHHLLPIYQLFFPCILLFPLFFSLLPNPQFPR